MKKVITNHFQSGQALVALLVLIMVGLTITSTAVSLVVANSLGAQKFQDSQLALAAAESGAENAMIRILRDPNYSGEVLPVGDGTATITVNGDPKVITSVGEVGNFQRTITVQLTENQGIFSIDSWEETE